MANLLVHHWSHPTTPAGVGWDIVQTGVRLLTEKGFSAHAQLGEADVIRVLVDDSMGTADFKTLHRWYMVETAISGEELVWNGYITDQYIDRGDEGDLIFPTGTARRWELEITQENTLLGFRVVRGAEDIAANGFRPEERPGARLRWILASPFLSTVHDHGLIDWAALDAATLMNANDYRGQTAGDVLRDISLKTGYNHYARYRDASSDIELAFYDANTSTLDSSTLRVSNSIADLAFSADGSANFASNLTWPPHHPVRLHRKGDRVAAGVLVRGNGVQSYGFDYATSYEFGARDMVVSDNNTNTQAQADALRDRLLQQHDEQDERIIGLRIQVPAANLNAVKHGQRMEAKFVHEPGWEDFRWARVVSKSFSRPDNETQALYDIDLELSPQTDQCPNTTTAGYYPPLGGPNSATVDAHGIILYSRAGGGIPWVATPFWTGASTWHFAEFRTPDLGAHNPAGWTDGIFGILGNNVYIIITGAGTLTIWTRHQPRAPTGLFKWQLQHLDVDGSTVVTDQTGDNVTPGGGTNIVIPLDTTYCTKRIVLSQSSLTPGGAVPAFNGAAFDGITWTPA